MSKDCKARRVSDQMCCHRCGLVWDVNDPDPPKCNNGKPVNPATSTTKRRRSNKQYNMQGYKK